MNDSAYLCLDRDIEEGVYKTFSLFFADLIAKKENGVITVAINRCEHRGFKPASGCGKIADGIACPYHGQKFEFKRALPVWKVGEMVFVGLYENAAQTLQLTAIGSDLGDEFGYHTQTVKAMFYLWVQNTADPFHLRTVHGNGFADLFAGTPPRDVLIEKWTSSYEMDLKPEVVEKYRRLRRNSMPLPFHSGFFHAIVMPHLSITSFLGIFYSLETANPVEGGTEVKTRFFTSATVEVPKLMKRFALDANIKILMEDRSIVERWAESYDRHGFSEYRKGEERIAAYMSEMYRRGYAPVMKRGVFE